MRLVCSVITYVFLLILLLGMLQQHIIFKIDQELVHMDLDLCGVGGKLDIEKLKVELPCLYFLQLAREKRSRGKQKLFFLGLVLPIC